MCQYNDGYIIKQRHGRKVGPSPGTSVPSVPQDPIDPRDPQEWLYGRIY